MPTFAISYRLNQESLSLFPSKAEASDVIIGCDPEKEKNG